MQNNKMVNPQFC